MSGDATAMPPPAAGTPGLRTARRSFWMLLGMPVALVFAGVWATIVDTSPTLSDEERVRGWETVLRELPATLLLLAVPTIGLVLAVRAGRQGAVPQALRAIWLHGAALLFALLVTMNGSTENIMTTRPSTVKWLLFPLQIGLTALAVTVARRAARPASR